MGMICIWKQWMESHGIRTGERILNKHVCFSMSVLDGFMMFG